MIDGKFDVVFRGQTVKGIELAIVKENLVQLFKSSPQAIEKLFAGGEVSIKKGLEYSAAMKYQAALRKAGALALIKEVEVSEPKPEPIQSKYSGKASFGGSSDNNQGGEETPASSDETTSPAAEPVQAVSESLASAQSDKVEQSPAQQMPSGDSELSVAEVGADIMPPKVYEKREVDTSELSMAPAGERILPPKPPEAHQEPNIEHLKLVDE